MIKRPNEMERDSPAWKKAREDREAIVDIAGEIYAETEKAFRFYDGKESVWLPKSQCQWDEPSKTMSMPMWLGKAKGLI